jgi:hypothetical protein
MAGKRGKRESGKDKSGKVEKYEKVEIEFGDCVYCQPGAGA